MQQATAGLGTLWTTPSWALAAPCGQSHPTPGSIQTEMSSRAAFLRAALAKCLAILALAALQASPVSFSDS